MPTCRATLVTVQSTVTSSVVQKEIGEKKPISRESSTSTKFWMPTKVQSPEVWANRDTEAPRTNGSTTRSARATAAGATHR